MANFFRELGRRHVIRVAGAYAVAGWLLAQIAVTLEDALNLPEWFDTVIVATLLIGFPIALLLAWAFEMTPDGIERTKKADASEPARSNSLLDMALLAGLVAVVGIMVYQMNEPGAPDSNSTITASTTDASIAVLPFVDLSDTGDQTYFSDGLSEELLNVLAQVEGLKVASRTSSFSFKDRNIDITEIAQVLGVAHVLEGSVRKAGNRLRITAQLIRANDGFHMWSETYDRDLNDIFAIQDDISNRILDEMRVRIMGTGQAIDTAGINPEAYELVLRAREANETYSVADLERSAALYRQAIEIDPTYAEAYARLASVELLNSNSGSAQGSRPVGEALRVARELLDKALTIDPKEPRVWLSIALMRQFNEEYQAAENAYLRAIDLQPNVSRNNYAMLLLRDSRLNEALQVLEQDRELNPRSVPERNNYVDLLLRAGRLAEARAEIDQVKIEFPDTRGTFSWRLYESLVLFNEGRWAESINLAKQAHEDTPDVLAATFTLATSYAVIRGYDEALTLQQPMVNTYVEGVSGQTDKALSALEPLLSSGQAPADIHTVAVTIAGIGRKWEYITDQLLKGWPPRDLLKSCEQQEYPHFYAAIAYRELQQTEKLEETLACWTNLLAKRRSNGFSDSNEWVERGALAALLGNTDEALSAFEEASNPVITNLHFEDWITLLGLADNHRGKQLLEDYQLAINRARSSLNLAPIDF